MFGLRDWRCLTPSASDWRRVTPSASPLQQFTPQVSTVQAPPPMDEQHVSEAEKVFEGKDPEDDGMNQNDTEDDGSKYLYFFSFFYLI